METPDCYQTARFRTAGDFDTNSKILTCLTFRWRHLDMSVTPFEMENSQELIDQHERWRRKRAPLEKVS